MSVAATDACKPLSYKERLQYEIIDISDDLERLTKRSPHHPQTEFLVDRIRDTLGKCVHLLDSVDTQEFCNQGGINER